MSEAQKQVPDKSGVVGVFYEECSKADADAAEQFAVAYVSKVGVSKESMIDAVSTLRAQVVTYGRKLQAAEAEVKRLRDALVDINRILSPGNRTMDELMRDMGYAWDYARWALATQQASAAKGE